MTFMLITRNFVRFIGSKTFFWLTVALLIFEAAWIALSARYPQAFDEQFHFGLIQLYSHHLSPFLHGQPAGADQFGPVAHDPSYLYHYLMSFPYRLIAHFTASQTVQIILLRLINVALFAASVPLFRRVLHYTSASSALINTALFFFVLTPVSPLLASQINYDNMVVPVTALSLLLTLRILRHLHRGQALSLTAAAWLIVVWALGSLVKYPFLPIAAAEFLVLVFSVWRMHRKDARVALSLPSRWKLAVAVVAAVLSLGLFCQRYGVNLVEFHSTSPECSKALSISQCKAYAPWARNFAIATYKTAPVPLNQELVFPFVWVYRVMGELLFTIGSAFNQKGTVDYYVGTQLLVMETVGWFVFGAGVLCVVLFAKRLWRESALRLFGAAVLLYVAALFAQNFLDFRRLGEITAVHGRYLLPLLPLLYIAVGLSVKHFFSSLRLGHLAAQSGKAVVAFVFMLVLLVNGGFVTYIVRNDDRWLWQQSAAVKHVNHTAKKVLNPVVLDKKN